MATVNDQVARLGDRDLEMAGARAVHLNAINDAYLLTAVTAAAVAGAGQFGAREIRISGMTVSACMGTKPSSPRSSATVPDSGAKGSTAPRPNPGGKLPASDVLALATSWFTVVRAGAAVKSIHKICGSNARRGSILIDIEIADVDSSNQKIISIASALSLWRFWLIR